MKRVLGSGFLLLLGAGLSGSCSSYEGSSEPIGQVDQGLTKCQEPTPGDGNFCTDPACPCTWGEGRCFNNGQCAAMDPVKMIPLACVAIGKQFGYPTNIKTCAATHCANNVRDGNETQIDCGGDCGDQNCPTCADVQPNPQTGHCNTDCPCPPLDGGCNGATSCQQPPDSPVAQTCWTLKGALFGYSHATSVCAGSTCFDMTLNGDETAVDCGGSCAPCPGSLIGAAAYGGDGNDRATGMVIDGSGDMILTGQFGGGSGTTDLDSGTLTSNGQADIFVAKFTSAGTAKWSMSFGGTGPDGDRDVVVGRDGAKNIYVAGNFWNSMTVGGTTLDSGSGTSVFVVKLNPNGGVLWAKQFGDTAGGQESVHGIAVDPMDGIYLTGTFNTSINFGPANHLTAGGEDIWVAKLDTAGNGVWSKSFGGVGQDNGVGIAVDNGGRPAITGQFTGSVSFGATALVSNGVSDAFISQLTVAGNPNWAFKLGGTGADRGLAVAIDPVTRYIYATGNYRQTVTFGTTPVTAVGLTDGYVISYTPAGVFRWSKQFGSAGAEQVRAIVFSGGKVGVSGLVSGSVDFGLGATPVFGGTDGFVVRYDALGNVKWGTTFGSPTADRIWSIATIDGALFVSGEINGAADFGAGPISAGGMFDIPVARFVF